MTPVSSVVDLLHLFIYFVDVTEWIDWSNIFLAELFERFVDQRPWEAVVMARSPAPSLCRWLCSRWCFKILRDCESKNFQECIILIYPFQLILMSVLSPCWCVGKVLAETNVFSPLTVPLSPDMMVLKLQQAAAKTVPASGRNRLLRYDWEQRDNSGREKPVDCAKAEVRSQLSLN